MLSQLILLHSISSLGLSRRALETSYSNIAVRRELVERYLDDSPELLLDQLPLQRVARDGQFGIFWPRGFLNRMDTFRDWTDLNRRWDAGDPWKVWTD
jgi:hypothetical protein